MRWRRCAADRPADRVGELARHWTAAPRPDGLPHAIQYTRRAGDDALAALAPGDALDYYTQALDLNQQTDLPDPLLDLDVRIGLGIAQRQTGHAEFRDTLLAAARQAADLGDTDRLAAAALANDRGCYSVAGLVDRDKVDILELALQRVSRDHPCRPLLLATLCSELTFDSTCNAVRTSPTRRSPSPTHIGDDATIVRVLNNVCWPLAMPQLLDPITGMVRRGPPTGRTPRRPRAAVLGRRPARRHLAINAGDVAEMERCFTIAWPLAERLDQPYLSWQRAMSRAHCALLHGDISEAETQNLEALDIGRRSGQPDTDLIVGYQLGGLNIQRGVFPDDTVAAIEQARDRLPGFRDWLTASLALEYARVGHLDLAQALLDEFAANGFEPPPEPTGWLFIMIHYTDVAIACDDHHAAAALYERLIPYADQIPTKGSFPYPPIDHYLGKLATLLGRYEQANQHFTGAAEFTDRAGATYLAAEIDLAWGHLFLQRSQAGDDQRARARLDSARSAATARGYADLERRATEALQRLG